MVEKGENMGKNKKILRLFPHAEASGGDRDEKIERDMPDEAEHPALQAGSTVPRISKNVYRVAAVLVAAVLVLLLVLNWNNLSPANIGNWIRTKAVGLGFGDGYPTVFTGNTAEAGNFGAMDGNVYVVSDTALTVMNSTAKTLFSVRHSYNNPCVSAVNDRFLLYNAEGTGYRVETASGTQVSGTSEGPVTTGAMSGSGKFALAVQASDYASALHVYKRNGTLQYRYGFADTYITAVALNGDGTRGAVASVTSQNGAMVSRITILDFSSKDAVATFESTGNLVLSLLWNKEDRVIAVGDTATLVSDRDFNFTAYDYGGREVTAYGMTDTRAVVSVSNFAYGGDSTLLIFGGGDKPLEVPLPARAAWLSTAGAKVTALLPDSVVAVDLVTGEIMASCPAETDTKSIAMGDESTVYTLGVREIRKETLKVIPKEEQLSQAP